MGRARRVLARAGHACAGALLLCNLMCAAVPLWGGTGAALAAEPAAGEPAPGQVRDLLVLLADPAVRDWITRQVGGGPPAEPAQAPAPATAEPATGTADAQAFIGRSIEGLRTHLRGMAQALPTVPGEIVRAGMTLRSEIAAHGIALTAFLVAAFAGLGFGAEWLFWWATAGYRRRAIIEAPLGTVDDRLHAVLRRFVYGVLIVATFALGSLGAFLALDWPPLLQRVVGASLFVVLVGRTASAVGRILLAPAAPRFRVLPMPQESAEHWFLWLQVIATYGAAEVVLFGLMRTLGVSPPALAVLIQAVAFGGMALTVVALFRRPAHRAARPGARARTWAVALGLVLSNLARAAGALPVAVLIVVALALPAAVGASRRAVVHLLRPPGTSEASAAEPLRVGPAMLERSLQAVLVVAAVWLVARSFGLDLESLARDGTPATRIARGVFDAVLVLLAADLIWHLVRSWIDRKLYEAADGMPAAGALNAGGEGGDAPAQPDLSPDEARHRARLLTLLPILRNVGFVVFAVLAVLTALSALGVQVGPLLAGAGVVGIAVGFGAQTLVKDVISGLFFLLDDAFRVGEYIESGSIRGTVEAFSLRSVKLRHHRGYLHTVPFGSLDTITNYSRDYVIDKVTIGVAYDTDLDKVKRIIKQVGRELLADPELAPNIIETLKMQGVDAYSETAVQVRLKMTTKPGQQFVPRRRAYGLIKKAFEREGIEFAQPTVRVAGDGRDAAAASPAAGPAAAAALEAARKPAAVA